MHILKNAINAPLVCSMLEIKSSELHIGLMVWA